MRDEVAALLDVQSDDLRIYALEDRLAALGPRLAALEKDRKHAEDALVEARKSLTEEERRQRDVQDRLRQHRELRDRSESLLGQVTEPRQAAAAMAQIEQARRFIADEEQELERLSARLGEIRKTIGDRESAVAQTQQAQHDARASLDADRGVIEQELRAARTDRDGKAGRVPRSLLQKYDKIRSKRRSTAMFPLRGSSCAHCDTAIPVQRHSTMVNSGATDVCEGCGVLLYVAEK